MWPTGGPRKAFDSRTVLGVQTQNRKEPLESLVDGFHSLNPPELPIPSLTPTPPLTGTFIKPNLPALSSVTCGTLLLAMAASLGFLIGRCRLP
jgi:hypothetical protein